MNDADELPEPNPAARAALLQALDDQLNSPETPEVKAEFARLVADGIGQTEAKEMMATILAFHIARLVKRAKDFDYAAYVAELKRLPDIDYDQEL